MAYSLSTHIHTQQQVGVVQRVGRGAHVVFHSVVVVFCMPQRRRVLTRLFIVVQECALVRGA